jgi:hypothetical protein
MRVRTESEEKFKQYLNHPRRERAVPLLNQEGSPSVRPGSLWREESAVFPLCLSASVVKIGLGDRVDRSFGALGDEGAADLGLGFGSGRIGGYSEVSHAERDQIKLQILVPL